MSELNRLRATERWIARIRLGAVAFALFQLLVFPNAYPSSTYERSAWATTIVLTVGALLIFWAARRDLREDVQRALSLIALAFDTAIVGAFVLTFAFEPGTPIRLLMIVPLAEAALRYGLRGGILLPVALIPVYVGFEQMRVTEFPDEPYDWGNVTFPLGVLVLAGLFIGWLVKRLREQTEVAEAQLAEAERLRDELGRRVDVLEAANRAARALGSSLDVEQAFGAFIRELRGLVPFDRMAIILADGGVAQVMATAGRAADSVFPPGTSRAVDDSALEDVLSGDVVYRRDMSETAHPEEQEFVDVGLRSRVLVPLLVGARAIGALSVVREQPNAFAPEEIDLLSLLGRLVGTAVQNIRAYEAERSTAEELRRLSALRADFVSLVSHELRSPMASVIGSARTLQARWRELQPEQRESFLALIADETTRLASLIGDVLDTSRIEAGTFSYAFSEVDLGDLVRDAVASAAVGQDEVQVEASVHEPLPSVRGDRERLRQVLTNLIDNAIKYSPANGEVRVTAYAQNGRVLVDVADRGPGIAAEQQKLIFEKFGRAKGGGTAQPGTGLGLFIARSIAEAHGGTLDVHSAPSHGATFRLALPLARGAG